MLFRSIMCLPSAWAEPASQGIYTPPFMADGPRNIMCLLSAWADPASQCIYPSPFIADGRKDIMCLPSAWAEPACQGMYPPLWAKEDHAPSKCMGRACLPMHISTPLHSGLRLSTGTYPRVWRPYPRVYSLQHARSYTRCLFVSGYPRP